MVAASRVIAGAVTAIGVEAGGVGFVAATHPVKKMSIDPKERNLVIAYSLVVVG
jgi:hypothetical protein